MDAVVVSSPQGEQVFSLTGAEHIYRVIIEAMNEGALTMDLGGYILFCNRRFCEMVKTPMEAKALCSGTTRCWMSCWQRASGPFRPPP